MSYSFQEIFQQVEESMSLYAKTGKEFKFIVDAQLPKKLSDFPNSRGYQSIHALELPSKNTTSDTFIKQMACNEDLIVITKDDDFLHSFLIEKKPPRLILIKTGNISNSRLLEIFEKGLATLAALIGRHPLIEITKEEIIAHN